MCAAPWGKDICVRCYAQTVFTAFCEWLNPAIESPYVETNQPSPLTFLSGLLAPPGSCSNAKINTIDEGEIMRASRHSPSAFSLSAYGTHWRVARRIWARLYCVRGYYLEHMVANCIPLSARSDSVAGHCSEKALAECHALFPPFSPACNFCVWLYLETSFWQLFFVTF